MTAAGTAGWALLIRFFGPVMVCVCLALYLAQPVFASSGTATAGQSVTFSVTVNGTAPFNYEWRKVGVAAAIGNGVTHTINPVKTDDAGTYYVVVSNSAGSTTSDNAVLSVEPAGASHPPPSTPLRQPAPEITRQPAPVTAAVGDRAAFSVAATGTAPLAYQWRKNGAAIAGATSDSYTIGSVQPSDGADYSVEVRNAGGATLSLAATLTVASPSGVPPVVAAAQFINLSSRVQVGAGNDLAISGFVVSGSQAKTLLLRGIGPGLAAFDVGGTLAQPELTVFSEGTVVATNAGWLSADANRLRTEAQRLGAFALPEDGRDCAILATFAPGVYTMHLRGRGETKGVGLMELYDADLAGGSRLANLSTRAMVGRDSAMLITGLVVAGPGPKTILVRAIGPGLGAYGLSGLLSRPKMTVLARDGRVIATNTGWTTAPNRDALVVVAAQVGAFPLDPSNADSALVLALDPGAFTIQVVGADGGTGLALVETYEVSPQ